MKILLATDGSAHSQAAINLLNHLPFPEGSKITLTTVLELPSLHFGTSRLNDADQKLQDSIRSKAEENLNRQAESLRQTGWIVDVLIRQGNAAEEVINTAEELKIDLIVVGSHGFGTVRKYLLGSVSQKVVKYAPCSVLVVRENEGRELDANSEISTWKALKVLLAFDDSEISNEAVKVLHSLPLADDAEVTIVTIMPIITSYGMDIIERTSDFWQEDKCIAKAALQATAEKLKQTHPNISAHLIESEDTSHEILARAKALNSDLIIMGNKGKNMMDRFLLGSVTNRVIEHAPCSVWVVRKRIDQ